MIADGFHAAWRGFVRLFGLNACPAPLPLGRTLTPRERATRERLERLLRPL